MEPLPELERLAELNDRELLLRVARGLARLEREFERFRPLLDRYVSNPAGRFAARRGRSGG